VLDQVWIRQRLNRTLVVVATIIGVVGLGVAGFRPCCCQDSLPKAAKAEVAPAPCHGNHTPESTRGATPDRCDCTHECHIQQAACARTENLNLAPLPSKDTTSLRALDSGVHASHPIIELTRFETGPGPPGLGPAILPFLHTILRI
jgi:hypothetical protein